jgi:4a-hydroxytetrahydrobiopterin dehydratase
LNQEFAMNDAKISERMKDLEGWSRDDNTILKTYHFANYHETMAFVNATAWISHRADHHPDLTVGYNQCAVAYTTHSAGGLTHKDFDCAANVDALFAS